jgi:hypothetical protein
MIPVTCPRCNKVVGFEETEIGVLVACPYCRTLLRVTRSSVLPPDEQKPAESEPAGPPILPDEIGLLQEPEPEPTPLEIVPPEEPPPTATQAPSLELDEPEKADKAPAWDLDLYERKPEPVVEAEPPPDEVEVVSEEPDEPVEAEAVTAEPPPPLSLDVLEEVREEREGERERPLRKATPRRQERVRKKERIAKQDTPNQRILGGVAAGVGGVLLIAAIILHLVLRDSSWQLLVSGCDVFFLGLIVAGVFFLVKR